MTSGNVGRPQDAAGVDAVEVPAPAALRVHQPVVAESTTPGVWNVYCDACSQVSHDYIYPCREGRRFPPPRLRIALDTP